MNITPSWKFIVATLLVATLMVATPSFSGTVNAQDLTIGSKAPALDVENWIHNGNGQYDKVTEFESGKIYVVEFWATWCGPCIASMPHLVETQNKYADKSVQIVSVSDEDTETIDTFLEREVRGNGEEGDEGAEDAPKTYRELTSAYCLTSDPDGSTHADYMEAAGQNGIPTCFIVGKTGLIEWIGHPMRMDAPLEQLIAGTWDREKAAAEIKEQQKVEAAMGKVARAMQQGKHDDALAGIDEIIAGLDDSNEMKSALKGFRMQILMDAERYDDVAKALNELVNAKPIDSQTLNMHAWTIYEMAAADKDLNKDLVKAALKAAEKAVEGAPEDGMILDTLAHLLHHFGELDRAIEVQEKAVKNPGPAKEDIVAFLEVLKAEKADK